MERYLKFYAFFAACVMITSCNSGADDTVKKADSANQAIQDSNLRNNNIVIDEESAAFLVRIANSGMAETQMAAIARQNAVYPAVRDLAEMIYHDHSSLNAEIKTIAWQKQIVLPAEISMDKQDAINELKNKKGKNLDREFVNTMVNNHQAGVKMFEDAQLNTKDLDIRSFAGKTVPTLKMHLDSALAVQKKFW
jgi:putative membrane protein